MLKIPQSEIFYDEIEGQRIRCIKMPNKQSKHVILFLNGMHSNLERSYPLMKFYNKYATVISLDLPGLGESPAFKKIDDILQQYADFTYLFINKYLKNQTFIMVGASLGYIVGAILLINYPDLTKQIKNFIGLGGFLSSKQLRFSWFKLNYLRLGVKLGLTSFMQAIFRFGIYNNFIIKYLANRQVVKTQYKDNSELERQEAMQMEVMLWQQCDILTHFKIYDAILNMNIRTPEVIDTELDFLCSSHDPYLKFDLIRTDTDTMFSKVDYHELNIETHAPSYIASIDEIAQLIPLSSLVKLEK